MTSLRRHNRVLTLCAIGVVFFAAAFATVWTAPRVSGAVAAWLTAKPVHAVTMSLDQLAVAPIDGLAPAAGQRSLRAAPEDGGEETASAEPAPAVTLDAGGSFTLLGLTCRAPETDDGTLLWMRVSDDAGTWGPWYCYGAGARGRR